MDELSRQLHAAVAVAPPTRVDVDQLIEADVRRRRHRAWTLTGAVAVAAVLVVPAVLAGPQAGVGPADSAPPPAAAPTDPASPLCAAVSASPTGPQPPTPSSDPRRARPTESPEDGVTRLTGVLREKLRTALPPGVRLEPAQDGCTEPQFEYHPSWQYTVDGTLRRGEDAGSFRLEVFPTQEAMGQVCIGDVLELSCEVKEFPDGASTMAMARADERASGGGQLWALANRADGTSVLVITHNLHHEVTGNEVRTTLTAAEPLLTTDQILDIARTPGLTLHP